MATVATTIVGKNAKVTIGASKILGMGTWTMPGITTEQIDISEFEDDFKRFENGQKDGGEISFSGFYDKTDTTGQDVLRSANENDTHLTDIRFYVDANSYFTPTTTNPASYGMVSGYSIGADQAGMITTDFTIKISGKMELL